LLTNIQSSALEHATGTRAATIDADVEIWKASAKALAPGVSANSARQNSKTFHEIRSGLTG